VLDSGNKLAAAVAAFTKELNGDAPPEPARPSGPGALRPRFGVLRWMTS